MCEKKNLIYDRNLEILNGSNPEIALQIQDKVVDSEKYILEKTKEKLDTLKVANGEKYLYIQSRYYPKAEAEQWIKENVCEEDEIHIFFGFGMGCYVMELIKRIRDSDKIFIFEPDINIFKVAVHNSDLEKIFTHNNIFLCVGEASTLRDKLKYNVDYNFINKISVYYLPNYSILYSVQKSDFNKVVNNFTISNAVSRNTVNFFADRWQENFLKNIVYLFDGCIYTEFENKFKDMPVILVATGPSLTKNVAFLKEVKGRAVIICVGRALKVLLNEGIKPDIVAAIDGSELCAQQFDGLDYSDIILLYTPNVHPKIVENHKGRKILFSNFDTYIDLIMKQMGMNFKGVPSGNSVATVIFAFACFAGANPTIFIGQDLAYKGKETHAKGTYYGNNNDIVLDNKMLMSVPGINGGQVVTGTDLYVFLKWFEEAISEDKTERIYINATEGGANIEGTVVKTMSQVIDEYCKKGTHVNKVIDSVFDNRKQINNGLIREYIHGLELLPENMDEIISLCKKALRYNDGLYKNYKFYLGKNVRKLVTCLEEIDNTLLLKQQEFALLENIMRPIYDNISSRKKLPSDSTEREQGLSSAEMGEAFYKSIKEEIEKTKPMVIEMIEKMKTKYLETDGGMMK